MKTPRPTILALAIVAVLGFGLAIGYRWGSSSRLAESVTLPAGGTRDFDSNIAASKLDRDLSGNSEYSGYAARDGAADRSPSAPLSSSSQALQLEFARLTKEPQTGESRERLRDLLLKWGQTNPADAIAASKALTGRDRTRFLAYAAAGWARVDPNAAWDFMMEESANGRVRSLSLEPIVTELARRDPSDAMRRLQAIGDEDTLRDGVRSLIRTATYSGSYAETLEALSEISDTRGRVAATTGLFRVWSDFDPDAPLVAIDSIENPDERAAAFRGFMQGWAQSDSLGAFQYLIDNYDDPEVASASRDIGRQLAGSLTATELIETLNLASDPKVKLSVATSILSDIARVDPSAAMSLAEQIDDSRQQDRSIRSVMEQWAQSDFDAAAKYFTQLDSDHLKAQSIEYFARQADSYDGDFVGSYLQLVSSIEAPNRRYESMQEMAKLARNYRRSGQTDKSDRIASAINDTPLLDEKSRQKLLERVYAD